MRRRLLPMLAALLPAVGVVPPALAQGGVAEEYQKLLQEYQKAEQEFIAARKAITESEEFKKRVAARDTAGARELQQKLKSPAEGFVPRFLAFARSHAGDAGAFDALLWVVKNAATDKDAVTTAADAIVAGHLDHEQVWLVPLAAFYLARGVGNDGAREVLDAIVDKSSRKEAVAEALYARSAMVRRDRGASEEAKQQAEADIAKLREVAPDSTAALRVDGEKFARERLQIGMEAPDIEGVDLDGVAFKLSDYRGKVVVLDFWGDW